MPAFSGNNSSSVMSAASKSIMGGASIDNQTEDFNMFLEDVNDDLFDH